MRRAISPRFATSNRRIAALVIALETEDAEAVGAAHFVAMHRRQRDAQHGSRVPWVDDAVVGHASRRVERARLSLGAILHRCPEPGVFLLVERPSRGPR